MNRIELRPESKGLGMTSQRARDRLVERLREQGIRDERVLNVMRALPRHAFIDEGLASRAYEDTALPIGNGQTISQPWVVARMTEAARVTRLPYWPRSAFRSSALNASKNCCAAHARASAP